jgi:hypothetical protein
MDPGRAMPESDQALSARRNYPLRFVRGTPRQRRAQMNVSETNVEQMNVTRKPCLVLAVRR